MKNLKLSEWQVYVHSVSHSRVERSEHHTHTHSNVQAKKEEEDDAIEEDKEKRFNAHREEVDSSHRIRSK